MAAIETPLTDLSHFVQKEDSTEKDVLVARLDELLEKYLNTLDEYQKAREQLSKQLSSGFMSLAQANFQNRSSSTHYGRDCYDERMQAIRHVNVRGETGDKAIVSILSTAKNQDKATAPEKAKSAAESETHTDDTEEESVPGSSTEEPKEPEEGFQKNMDPIRWFGILVPPALRSAQASFVAAVEDPIPHVTNIARNLRSQEIEIGRVRKQIKKL